ncbi:hypothetical protein HWV62_6795 [Athelia sp. TMB]|nr:hypothetical protein HWV62_6795 [Athelia sp. TMB]
MGPQVVRNLTGYTPSSARAGRPRDLGFSTQGPSQVAFPLLQHLILGNIKMKPLKLSSVARIFPQIERLTLQGVNPGFEVGMSLTPWVHTPSRQIQMALLTPLSIGQNYTLSRWQDQAQHQPPQTWSWAHKRLHSNCTARNWHSNAKAHAAPALIAHASGDMMARLRKLVEVEEFGLDWPTLFELFNDAPDTAGNSFMIGASIKWL